MNFPELISKVLRFNIVGENAYKTRFIGFKSELYFSLLLDERGTESLKGT